MCGTGAPPSRQKAAGAGAIGTTEIGLLPLRLFPHPPIQKVDDLLLICPLLNKLSYFPLPFFFLFFFPLHPSHTPDPSSQWPQKLSPRPCGHQLLDSWLPLVWPSAHTLLLAAPLAPSLLLARLWLACPSSRSVVSRQLTLRASRRRSMVSAPLLLRAGAL